MEYAGELLWPGHLGHFAVIVSFCAALMSTLSYGHALNGHTLSRGRWEQWGRWSFGIHSAAVFTIIATLFGIIYFHRYEYHYAWSHASRHCRRITSSPPSGKVRRKFSAVDLLAYRVGVDIPGGQRKTLGSGRDGRSFFGPTYAEQHAPGNHLGATRAYGMVNW